MAQKEEVIKKKDIIFKSKAKKPVKGFFKGVPKRMKDKRGRKSTVA